MSDISNQELNPYQAPVAVEDAGLVPLHELAGQLRWVRRGLIAILAGIASLLGSWLIGLVLVLLTNPPAGEIGLSMMVLGGLGMILFGQACCVTVPKEASSRGWAIASLASNLIALAANVIPGILFGTLLLGAPVVAVLICLSGSFLLQFVINLSVTIGRTDIARRTRTLFVLGLLTMVGMITFWLMIDTSSNGLGIFSPIAFTVGICMFLGLLGGFCVLLISLAQEIGRALNDR